jgi:energy-coupling factor transport system substrate-specific component
MASTNPAPRGATTDENDGGPADLRDPAGAAQAPAPANPNRWRTVDIVVTAVLGAAFGVIFWGWNTFYEGPATFLPLPGRALFYGVWLVPAVLGPLVIRKPGAGILCEVVASTVSTFFGSPWGLMTLLYGVLQGMAGEFGFAFTAYRSWRWPAAVLSGALAGGAAALLDITQYYASYKVGWQEGYAALVVVSSALVAGLGSLALTRALAQTGVLDVFPSGRERELI